MSVTGRSHTLSGVIKTRTLLRLPMYLNRALAEESKSEVGGVWARL